ncbi:MAG: hypothetical protein ACXVBE_13435, partial [Bdellovibrionota bacterium]
MKTLACALLLFTSSHSLSYAAEAPKIEGISLSDTMDFQGKSGAVKLKRFSAGLRYKKIVFVKAKVYV